MEIDLKRYDLRWLSGPKHKEVVWAAYQAAALEKAAKYGFRVKLIDKETQQPLRVEDSEVFDIILGKNGEFKGLAPVPEKSNTKKPKPTKKGGPKCESRNRT